MSFLALVLILALVASEVYKVSGFAVFWRSRRSGAGVGGAALAGTSANRYRNGFLWKNVTAIFYLITYRTKFIDLIINLNNRASRIINVRWQSTVRMLDAVVGTLYLVTVIVFIADHPSPLSGDALIWLLQGIGLTVLDVWSFCNQCVCTCEPLRSDPPPA